MIDARNMGDGATMEINLTKQKQRWSSTSTWASPFRLQPFRLLKLDPLSFTHPFGATPLNSIPQLWKNPFPLSPSLLSSVRVGRVSDRFQGRLVPSLVCPLHPRSLPISKRKKEKNKEKDESRRKRSEFLVGIESCWATVARSRTWGNKPDRKRRVRVIRNVNLPFFCKKVQHRCPSIYFYELERKKKKEEDDSNNFRGLYKVETIYDDAPTTERRRFLFDCFSFFSPLKKGGTENESKENIRLNGRGKQVLKTYTALAIVGYVLWKREKKPAGTGGEKENEGEALGPGSRSAAFEYGR